jgi:transcriptional regulator with XRE-family HTH domain
MTQALRIARVSRVEVHDLLGLGVAAVRREKRWTQEDLARELRYHGLTSWRTGSVGQLEAGLRRPRLDEVVLICAALGVALDDLLPDSDEFVELGDGAKMRPGAIRAVLHGEVDADPVRSITEDMIFPGETRALQKVQQDMERMQDLLQPLVNASPRRLTRADVLAPGATAPTDADRHAARQLRVQLPQVRVAAQILWGRSLTEEREARLAGEAAIENLPPRSIQARRGLVTRGMLTELRALLDTAYGRRDSGAGEEVPGDG